MACDRPQLVDYMTNFTGIDPVSSVVCPFAQTSGNGLGLGVPLAVLLILGPVGLGLTVRNQSPTPLIVAGVLTAGVFSASMAGQGAQIAALVLLFAIIGVGFVLYRRAKTAL